MRKKAEVAAEAVESAEATAEKKKTVRKSTAKTTAKKSAEAKVVAPVVLLQYQGCEVDTAALVEAAKADFTAQSEGKAITDLKLYLKPEEHAAYYVVNDEFNGKVDF